MNIEYRTTGKKAQNPPDPKYPLGVDLNLAHPRAEKTCKVALPYPAEAVGMHLIKCPTCGVSVGVSAAGRADDPRSVVIGCKTD